MDVVSAAIVLLLILIAFVAAGRAWVWWYFGISRMVRALESIDESLRELPAVRRAENSRQHGARRIA
ncbi:MAG: hypothetical protein ACREQ5_26765 [Candidatus Dormibacteria bacterium]